MESAVSISLQLCRAIIQQYQTFKNLKSDLKPLADLVGTMQSLLQGLSEPLLSKDGSKAVGKSIPRRRKLIFPF